MEMISISQIITIVLFVLIGIGSLTLGNYIQKTGQPTVDFCNLYYKDKTFMKTMLDNEPYEPVQCPSSRWRTGWLGYCNSTCFEMRDKCLEDENVTKDQIRFSQKCGWMGPDYLILAGSLFFKYALPLMLLVTIVGIIMSDKEPQHLYSSEIDNIDKKVIS